MLVASGSRLGPYEIKSLLGRGGMGEVYRAHDTRLNRDVALKILPELFALDPDRLARFKREAQLLASLNHPNIAAIYGFEESDGIRALVLELVEGPTLAETLAELSSVKSQVSGLPLDEALPIARQICEALEAAHERGIVHRDLKPANIKLTADGNVKVLDFGLAKALAPDSASATAGDLSQSPTITSPAIATGAGVLLGTAAYMAPEQAKGRAADKRSDVWAFGCVLYEMLTGRRAFDGEDMADVLGAVVRLDPDWSRVPSEIPPAIRTLLQGCLVKDRRHRVADISTARFVLDNATSLIAPSSAEQASSGHGARTSGKLGWIAAAAAVLVAVVLAIPAVRYFREAPPADAPEMRTEIVTPVTADPVSFALSPDGRQLVFVASGEGPSRLWLRLLTATSAQPLAGTEGAAFPFWSPDSRSVGFFADGALKRLDIGGGQPQTLTDAVPRGGTWNADGVILFARSLSSPLFRASASGGAPVALTKLDRQSNHRFPYFLPDGRQFLFYALGTPETRGIYLGSLDSVEMTRLTAADTAGAYLPSGQTSLALRATSRLAGASREGGWLVWMRAGTLVAQRLDLERRALVGHPVTLADPVAFDPLPNVGALSVSTTGLVAYRPGGGNRRQLAWFDRSGKALGTIGAPENGLGNLRLSPDGRRVVVYRTVQGNSDIWLLDGARTSRFTFDAALDRFAVWSPDGSRIVFDSNRKGTRNLYVKASSGAGGEELFLESPQDKVANDWSADGRFLLYQSNDPQTNWDLWVLPLEGDRKPWTFLKTTSAERWAQFSPDGRWVVYMSNESGRFEIYVRAFMEPAARVSQDGASGGRASGQWQVSTAGGIYPRWRPDGKELYYLGPNGQMMAAPITVSGTTIEPGAPAALFPTRIFGGGVDNQQGREYDVARDGRFLINTVLDDAAAPITLLVNWKPPAK